MGARAAGGQFQETGGAPGAVSHFTIFQGMGYAKLVERRAIVDSTANEFIGRNVGMGVYVAINIVGIDAFDILETVNLFEVDGWTSAVHNVQIKAGLRVFGAAFSFSEGKSIGGITQRRRRQCQPVLRGT